MSKPRMCPHCKKCIPIDHGFSFDDDLNLLCGHCGKVAFPAKLAAEPKPQTYSTNYSGYTGGYTGAGHSYGGHTPSHGTSEETTTWRGSSSSGIP